MALVIGIHKETVAAASKLSPNNHMVKHFKNLLGLDGLFDSFSGDLTQGSFGFNGIIKKVGEAGNYVDFSFGLPVIVYPSSNTCEKCKGSGFDEENDMRCFRCKETGKAIINDPSLAFVCTASLGLLFQALESKVDPPSNDYQHIDIRAILSQPCCHNGSSLSGTLGIDFCDLMFSESTEATEIIVKTRDVMKTAIIHMAPASYRDPLAARVICSDTMIILDCPGDGSGLCTVNARPGQGADFSSHNLDDPGQALTLLAGLASLVEQVDAHLCCRKNKFATA